MTETDPSPSIPELLAYRWTKAQPLLTAYVGSLVADFSIAEDIVQEVAVAVARQFDVGQAERPFMPWVFGIARNQMKMHLREKYRRVVVFNSDALDQVEAAYLGMEQEAGGRREALRHCTEKLNQKARQLVECRYASGLGPAEIADRVGTTPNTVSVALGPEKGTVPIYSDRDRRYPLWHATQTPTHPRRLRLPRLEPRGGTDAAL